MVPSLAEMAVTNPRLTKDVLSRVITFANGKGGVGKTSCSANFAGLCAAAGWTVLFVDFDAQGDAGNDLGYKDTEDNDRGAHMLQVLDAHKPLQPVLRQVRPNLDVIPMGRRMLKMIEHVLEGKRQRGTEFRLMLAEALAPIARDYDLIVIDTPPDRPDVLQLVFGATRWLVIPTKSDRSSIGNLQDLSEELEEVRHANPDIEILGVVPYDFDTNAGRIKRNAIEDIHAVLGDASDVFYDADDEVVFIRHSNAAVDARNAGKLVHELAEMAQDEEEPWWQALREGRKVDRIPGSVGGLAGDHLLLTNAILTRINSFEEAQESA
ncbi:ParA family ATPase [Nocardioides sp. PD653]|nr:ParA family ATPase [Nocardioides sp. PD653-B2]GAW55578.1 ParA family ATPase [Nocardioides sp. PD653]